MNRIWIVQKDGLITEDPLLVNVLQKGGVRPGGIFLFDIFSVYRNRWLFKAVQGSFALLKDIDIEGEISQLPQQIEFSINFDPPEGLMNIHRVVIDCSNPKVIRIGECSKTHYDQ